MGVEDRVAGAQGTRRFDGGIRLLAADGIPDGRGMVERNVMLSTLALNGAIPASAFVAR